MLFNMRTFGATQKQVYTGKAGVQNKVTEQSLGENDLTVADSINQIVLCCPIASNSEQSPSWETA
jgi:hypothetical protein